MTRAELIDAVEATGATNVVVTSRSALANTRLGVALVFDRGGEQHVKRVILLSSAVEADAYPELIAWAAA